MSEWLKVETPVEHLGVDRQANEGRGAVRGIILAQEGPFKTRHRGEFDRKSIRSIVKLGKEHKKGLLSRYTHPDASTDSLGKGTGRIRNIRYDTVEKDGQELAVARGDHFFYRAAHKTPAGENLADYLMTLADEDTEAVMMSMVLERDEEFRLDSKDRPKLGDDGEPLPPLWRPTVLHASDWVGDGDATTSLLSHGLSSEGLPDEAVRQVTQLLRSHFEGKSREYVKSHCEGFLKLALEHYFPGTDEEEEPDCPQLTADDLRRQLRHKLRLTKRTA